MIKAVPKRSGFFDFGMTCELPSFHHLAISNTLTHSFCVLSAFGSPYRKA